MLKEARMVTIQGASFDTLTKLPLLIDEAHQPAKATLIYGRNGSGKSTIAHAFRKIKDLPVDNIQTVFLQDEHDISITLSDSEKEHIHIFDEDFVNENVRIQDGGLGTIVMLGEQAGLTDLIASATTALEEANNDCAGKKAILDEYNDPHNPKSPLYYKQKMRDVLQQDSGWAGRKREIDGSRRNASVTMNTYNDFLNIVPTKSRDELLLDYATQTTELAKARSGASKIFSIVPSISPVYLRYDIDSCNNLLAQAMEHPELTERECYLLNLVQEGKSNELKATIEEFLLPDLTICPKCHQTLTVQYKTDLVNSIKKVLSKEVENHQHQLALIKLDDIAIDLSPYQCLQSYQECIEQIDATNVIFHRNNVLIQAKMDDPYTASEFQLIPFAEELVTLSEKLAQLEKERLEYNQAVADPRPIISVLTQTNNEIAHWDIIEYAKTFAKVEGELKTVENEWKQAQETCIEKQNHLNDLNAQRDSINIAIDVINDGLRYIFFSEERMKIHAEDGVYKLISNGNPVKPKDISVGERNIIGLCYFFTNILERKKRENAHAEEYLLVIDDPVSSFDLENKIGILSYLKYQLGKFLLGNNDTRVLLMTHDLLTALDIGTIFDELMKECKKKYNGHGTFVYSPKELRNKQLIRFVNKRNEYTNLLSLIYDYAQGGSTEHGPYIGNILRQVLEAFSTFEYKKGISDVSVDDEILSTMEHEEHRLYFKNLMYRLILNGDSHRENQTRNMQIDFFTLISDTEKMRTAKEILCFMRLLNAPHVKAHLGDNAMSDIDRWCEEIRTHSAIS